VMPIGRPHSLAVAVLLLSGLAAAGGEPDAPSARRSAQSPAGTATAGPEGDADSQAQPDTPDSAAVERGLVERGLIVYGFYCMNCHGGDGRGGRDGGSDLRESEMLKLDDGGKAFAAFLPVGRPEQRMPATPLPEKDVADLWAFLRVLVASPADANAASGAEIAGDARQGKRHFETDGCASCHSTSGDLVRIGGRLDAKGIHGRLLEPRPGGVIARTHPDGAETALGRHAEHVKKLTEQARRDVAVYLATLR